jgi:hypothetical protein
MTDKTPRKTAPKDAFRLERSNFLDAFAALEENLHRSDTALVDERLLNELLALRRIRNDVVHSTLKFIQFDGELHAIVINAQDAHARARPARLLKSNDLTKLAEQLKRLNKAVASA